MSEVRKGSVIEFGNNQKAVVFDVLDAAAGRYRCVYRQNRLKYVVQEFTFDGMVWETVGFGGRVLRESEYHSYIKALA